ncbi:uncharacterized protein LOC115453544 [Manduca sexta]|uniref:Uncharacterized protein n=1 Tax=Manduca sexta TaxID=7130 RepID=A0A921YN94_MANSE|nr:uncharacterized protein LOC115453544 [Manduca sexta]KAG6442526.1 hypothetical protein O3G_MSEX002425 [Manduca sexta]
MSMSWSEWGLYAALTISGFIGFLILHFIVKVINDARLEARYMRIHQKASTNQGTQVHCPLAEITARAPRIPLENMLERQITTPNKISLVFNKQHNLQENKKLDDIIDSGSETTSMKVISSTSFGTKSCESIVKPSLLGNIYNKNNSDTSDVIEVTPNKEEGIGNESVKKDETEYKTVMNLTNQNNYQDLKEWIVGIVKKIPSDDKK